MEKTKIILNSFDEIKKLYKVQYTVPRHLTHIKNFKDKLNEKRFGIVDHYNESAPTLWEKEKLVVVSDAIFPDSFCLEPEYIKCSVGWDDNLSKIEKIHEDEEFAKAQELSNSLTGIQVGSLFQLNVADGQATYIVTQVGKRTCRVEWRGWGNGDRYTDHHFGFGGSFPIKDIRRYTEYEQNMHKIFSQHK